MSSNAVRRAKGKTGGKKRAQRATSNVFSMLSQDQINEFKEAFNVIDSDRNGIIDVDDLRELLNSLGKTPSDNQLEGMLSNAPGQMNFTMFLTMFGERLQGTDPETVILNAFACFDEDATGCIPEERLRDLLVTMGDRFTEEQVDEIFRDAPIKDGMFFYKDFTKILKYGTKEKDDKQDVTLLE